MPWLIFSEFSINIARGIFVLAIGMLLYEASDSLWAFTFVFASEFAIGLFLQGLAGSIVDKHGPSKVLLIAALASSAVLAIPLMLYQELSVYSLMFIAFGLNLFRPFIRNSIFVMIPQLVPPEQLEKLNAYISMALQAGQIIGMALAGLLLELFDPVWTIHAVFYGYFLALFFYRLATWKQQKTQLQENKTTDNKGSWKEVKQFLSQNTTAVYIYIVATLDYMALALFNLLLAPSVKHNFDNLPRWLTFIDGSFALGAMLGGLYIAKKPLKSQQKLSLTSVSMFFAAAIFAGYALKLSIYAIMSFTFVFGILTTISTVAWMSAQQRIAPDHIKGRLASVRYIANACLASLATIVVSYANDFSLTQAATVAACALLSILMMAWFLKPAADSFSEQGSKSNES